MSNANCTCGGKLILENESMAWVCEKCSAKVIDRVFDEWRIFLMAHDAVYEQSGKTPEIARLDGK